MLLRDLEQDELERVWTIDRREVIENVYYLEDGELVLRPEHREMQVWPPGEREWYTPILQDCFDRVGVFLGAFEEGELVGAAVLDSKPIGSGKDRLQLKFLCVSHSHREKRIGKGAV